MPDERLPEPMDNPTRPEDGEQVDALGDDLQQSPDVAYGGDGQCETGGAA